MLSYSIVFYCSLLYSTVFYCILFRTPVAKRLESGNSGPQSQNGWSPEIPDPSRKTAGVRKLRTPGSLAGGSPQADLRLGRLPTSRFTTREAPHKQIYDQGSSPQISVCNPRGSPRGLPLGFQTEIHFKPRASPQEELRLGRLPTSRVTTREAPHKQNYDQGAYPQAELRSGSWLAGWLAELAGWLAGWLGAGWLACRGPERPREAQRSTEGAWIEQACRELGWGLPTSRFTTMQGGSPQADL